MAWMANTDVQPSTDVHAVLSYIAKYVSKPEKKSVSYAELQAQILPYTSDRAPLLSFTSKMLNKLISERDWSAQEVSHILLGLQVQDASRIAISLDCRPKEKQHKLLILKDSDITARRSPLQHYQHRIIATDKKPAIQATLQEVSFLD